MKEWLSVVGIDSAKTRVREHTEDELSHYSKRTCDIEFETPFGWKELYGLAYRTDFDLKNHMDKTGINLQYRDPVTNEQYIPHVVEPTFGLTRSVLMVLLSAYNEEEVDGETRVVLKLNPAIAPVKVAVLPLQKKLEDDAMKVYDLLKKDFACEFDLSGSIGKRYRRQDEIGTPYCVTFDFESLEDNSVTVRDRDTMQQERISIDDLNNYLKNKMS